jgi:subtilisin family serine protease
MLPSAPPRLIAPALAFLLVLGLLVPTTVAWGDPSRSESPTSSGTVVHPELEQLVAETDSDRVQALLRLEETADLRGTAGREAVIEELKAVAAASQARVEEQIERRVGELGDARVRNTFWLANLMLIDFAADPQALEALATLDGVAELTPNFEETLPEHARTEGAEPSIVDDRTWGVDRIGADRVWSDLGIDGSGIRIAVLDTGVDIDHPDLADRMVTDDPSDPYYPGGWIELDGSGDPVDQEPYDSHYHGTHVAGTAQGGGTSGVAIGVAPGADMMHANVLPGGGGTTAQVIAGMQWAAEPFDRFGNPAGEPAHVVNMSLGGAGCRDIYIDPVRNLQAAGIFLATSSGNSGAGNNNSPGDVYDANMVGATTETDEVASFSSGNEIDTAQCWSDAPDEWPDTYITPDVSAPGANVYSADPGGGYRRLNGTSMASPHVAGVAALMLQAAPELGVGDVLDVLVDTAFWEDRYAPSPPDIRFGHGRIDALAAVELVALNSGIEGTVVDAADGEPIANAEVAVPEAGRSVTTDEDGQYTLRLEPGDYDLEASAFGYDGFTQQGVTVSGDEFTQLHIELDAAPSGTIDGTVSFAPSGEGVPGAGVRVLDVPVDLSDETDADGGYQISGVPEGTYLVDASADGLGDVAPVEVTVVADGTVTADFVLPAPPDDVVVVGSTIGAPRLVDFLVDNGVDAERRPYSELTDLPQEFSTLILTYGASSSSPTEDEFLQFLDATDSDGSGVMFLDHAFGTQGIALLSNFTGQPESRSDSTGGSIPTYYQVVEEHEIFAGLDVGETFDHDVASSAGWMAWFDGYSDGDRTVIADVGRSGDGIMGQGIGVEERSNNRHVLMSSHGVSSTRNPSQWSEESAQIFLNALDWVAPESEDDRPFFQPFNLDVDPDVVVGDETVDVSVEVKNIGGSAGEHDVVLRVDGETEASTTVSLAPGESTAVSWTTSRTELGTYEVSVGHLSDTFRVRPPLVEVEARTVDDEPLAGAAVAYVHDGDLHRMGHTDADGELAFEIHTGSAELTLVVHTADGEAGDHRYLLNRDLDVSEDLSVSFAPSTDGDGDDLVASVDLALDTVDDDHSAAVYVRSEATAPHGFGFGPGTLYATPGSYETVAAHHVPGLAQDWWYASTIDDGNDWGAPGSHTYALGGELTLDLDAAATGDGHEIAVQWDLTDGTGTSLETILATELGPFADRLPAVLELEDLVDVLAGHSDEAADITMTLYDRTGQGIHAGTLEWDRREFTYDVSDHDPEPRGTYTLELEVETGPYAGTLQERDRHRSGGPSTGAARD